MKLIMKIITLFCGLYFCSEILSAQTNQVPDSVTNFLASTNDPIVKTNVSFDGSHVKTLSGKFYDKIQVSKIQPDGIVINYTAKEGGIAIAKVYFEDLPEEWREHYGYSSEKAKEFKIQIFNGQISQSRQWIVDEQNLKALKAEQAKQEEEQAARDAEKQKEILDLEIRIRTLEAQERTALATERMAAAQESQALNQELNQTSSSLDSARIASEIEELNSQLRGLRYGY
jgi:hypothetical protein